MQKKKRINKISLILFSLLVVPLSRPSLAVFKACGDLYQHIIYTVR